MTSEYNQANENAKLLEELKQFARDVLRMRWMQRAYFQSRDRYDLMDAKRCEKNIDAKIDEFVKNEQI
jgi:hypothetical protein